MNKELDKTKDIEKNKKHKARTVGEYEQMLIDFVKDEFKGVI